MVSAKVQNKVTLFFF